MQQRPIVLALLLCLATLDAATAQAQLCSPTADPCVVTASINVPSGSVFDLGGRDLVIAASRTLTVLGSGFMTILADDITLDDGARIVATGTDGVGGDVQLLADGAIVLDPSSRIDVSGGAGGALVLTAATLDMNGQIRANATLRDSEGGLISILTTGNASIDGTGIQGNSGNRYGCGGLLEILSDASVTVTAPIELKGGDCDGGDIDIDALGNITITPTAELLTIATYEFGSGGAIGLTAGGDVVVNGLLTQNGEGSFLEGGGDGGDLDVIGNNVTLTGAISANGGSPDGGGGFVDLTATGTLTLSGPVSLLGPQQGIGGDLLIAADGNTAINGTVSAAAGFVGGSFDVVTLGTLSMNAAGSIDVSGTGSPFGQYGGTVDLQACSLSLALGSDIIATGGGPSPRATIRTLVGNTTTIAGTLTAGIAVELRYRSLLPVFQPGFVVSPAPLLIPEPALPCCVACSGSTTTTSTSSSTSTSSTLGGPTTSLTVTTSSTSTSSSTLPTPCGAPRPDCRTPVEPFKAKLIVRDKSTNTSDKLVWKWVRGQATTAGEFGDPTSADGYVLCLWDVSGSPTLLSRVDAPAGGTCDGKACWRATGRSGPTGYKYVDPDLTPNGGQKVVLKAGVAGKAKAIVKGKGVTLDLPPLPLALPALVQLEGGGRCYQAYFTTTGVARNTATEFEGRASVPNTTTSTSTSTTSTTGPTPICGNGAREFPEQCDDGNLVGGDCCSSACTAEPGGQPCAEDGNVCTQDVCSGLGTCIHPAGNAGLTCRPATTVCDAAEQCTGTAIACPADLPLPDGTACDLSACATGETCTAGACGSGAPVVCPTCESCDETLGCIPTPAPVCRQTLLPEKSSLLVKERLPDDSDKIVWKWAKGEATAAADFGSPQLDDGYALCLYDESALTTTLVTSFRAPAAGVCAGVACWRTTSSGFKYVDPEVTPDGVRRLLLKAGANGLAGITFKAQGVNVPMPALPLGSVLRLQLQGNGECWQATFSPGGITQNDATGFKARSD